MPRDRGSREAAETMVATVVLVGPAVPKVASMAEARWAVEVMVGAVVALAEGAMDTVMMAKAAMVVDSQAEEDGVAVVRVRVLSGWVATEVAGTVAATAVVALGVGMGASLEDAQLGNSQSNHSRAARSGHS